MFVSVMFSEVMEHDCMSVYEFSRKGGSKRETKKEGIESDRKQICVYAIF